MPPRTYRSRLAKKEQAKNLRIAILMSLLTAAILGLLVYAGVPLFIRAVNWWSDLKNSSTSADRQDMVAPSPPRLIITSRITNVPLFDLRGFAEPGSTVEVYVNGQLAKQITTESNGQFLATGLQLQSGDNLIHATARDESGNISGSSPEESVTLDTKAPKLELASPISGAEFSGKTQQLIELQGTTDADARLWVNDRLVRVDDAGKFVTSLRLSDGSQEIEIKAVDQAGNETSQSLTVTYTP